MNDQNNGNNDAKQKSTTNTRLDELTEALLALLPPPLRKSLRANIRALLASHFKKMNLASQDELAAQTRALQRLHTRVQALSTKLDDLLKRAESEKRQPPPHSERKH